MNKLPVKIRVQILSMLCEGTSMRAASRLTDTSINTVGKLLIDAGKFRAAFHDDKVRDVKAKRVQCDEVWSFTYATQKAAPDGAGDTWTWTGIEADTKLIISWQLAVVTANTLLPSWTICAAALPMAKRRSRSTRQTSPPRVHAVAPQ